MLFPNRISAGDLAQTFRMWRVGLEAGFGLPEVVQKQATRGPWSTRPIMQRMGERLGRGDSLSEALEPEAASFPPLVAPILEVGEQTGHLSETCEELEEYFELQSTLKRNFWVQLIWPIIQIISVFVIITLFLLVLGALRIPIDPLGLGTGIPGVLKFWFICAVLGFAIWIVVHGIRHQLRFLAPVERAIIALPFVGPALMDLLLGRFSMGLKMSFAAGLDVKRALKLSFEAAGSSLFRDQFEQAKVGIKRGESVAEVLERCSIFPQEYCAIVANAEEGGQIPEVMTRVAKNYQEDAARKLRIITQVFAFLIYAAICVMIIMLIFRIHGMAIRPAYEI